MIELAQKKDFPLQDMAKWWLMNRKNNDWKAYDVEQSLKAPQPSPTPTPKPTGKSPAKKSGSR